MTTEEAIALAQNNQAALVAKRAAIVLRLESLQREIDALCAISEYARTQNKEFGDAAFNLSAEKWEPKEVIPFVQSASMNLLLEWERRANESGMENKYRELLAHPNP